MQVKNSHRKLLKLALFLLLLAPCQNLSAQIIDSSFYQWTIYELQSDEFDEKKCYMITYPIKSESDHNYREKPYIMITRYQNRRFEEVSVFSGYEYKIHSKVLVAIDDKKFLLTTNKDMSWTKNKNEDVFIIQKMLDSASLKVRSDSAIGTFAVDEYSLKGIAKAYNRLKKICE